MKKITLTLALAFIGLTAFAQVLETFDDGVYPEGWSSVVFSGECDYQFGSDLPTGDDFTSTAIFIDDDACGSGAPSSVVSLITAQYDLSTATSATLTVDVAFQVAGAQIFVIEVYDEDTQTTIAVLETFDADLDPDIQTLTYDITPYVAANTSFRFTFNDDPDGDGTGSWGWHAGIDNFTLDFSLSTDDNSIAGFKMFPNPANNVLNVAAGNNIETVTVFNMVGQKVLEEQVGATSSQLDIARLQTGAYLMQVTADGQVGTYKFVKQ